jgi:hypothetical protein
VGAQEKKFLPLEKGGKDFLGKNKNSVPKKQTNCIFILSLSVFFSFFLKKDFQKEAGKLRSSKTPSAGVRAKPPAKRSPDPGGGLCPGGEQPFVSDTPVRKGPERVSFQFPFSFLWKEKEIFTQSLHDM